MAVSCGLTLQICLIIALSFHFRRWSQGFVTGQVLLAWSIGLRTHELFTRLPKSVMDRQVQTNQYVPLNFFEIGGIIFFFFWGGEGGGVGGGGALELVNFFLHRI